MRHYYASFVNEFFIKTIILAEIISRFLVESRSKWILVFIQKRISDRLLIS